MHKAKLNNHVKMLFITFHSSSMHIIEKNGNKIEGYQAGCTKDIVFQTVATIGPCVPSNGGSRTHIVCDGLPQVFFRVFSLKYHFFMQV